MLRRLIISDQNPNNLYKQTGDANPCCGENDTVCRSTATYPSAQALLSMIVQDTEGVNHVLTFSPSLTGGAAAVGAGILAALTTNRPEGGVPVFEEDEDLNFDGVVVTGTTNLTVALTGGINVVSLTHASGTVAFTRTCTRVRQCTFSITGFAGGAANNLEINGTNNALGTVTPGTTVASAVKTAVDNALTAQSVTGTSTVTTTGSGGAQTYDITIAGVLSTTVFELNNIPFERTGCLSAFVA